MAQLNASLLKETPSLPSTTSEEFTVFVIFTGIILAIYICFSNGLVIASILRYSQLQGTKNIFIVAQSVADFLVGGVIIPIRCVQELLVREKGDLCHALITTELYFTLISMFTVFAICGCRYIHAIFPLRFGTLVTRQRCLAVIVLIWVYSSLLSIAAGIDKKNTMEDVHNELQKSVFQPCFAYMVIKRGYIQLFAAHIILSYLTSAALYCRIFYVALKSRRQIIAQMSVVNHQAAVDFKRESKISQKMALVLGVFAACWFPRMFAPHLFSRAAWPRANVTRFLLQAVAFSNSGHNVWVYAFSDKQFRKHMLSLLPRK